MPGLVPEGVDAGGRATGAAAGCLSATGGRPRGEPALAVWSACSRSPHWRFRSRCLPARHCGSGGGTIRQRGAEIPAGVNFVRCGRTSRRGRCGHRPSSARGPPRRLWPRSCRRRPRARPPSARRRWPGTRRGRSRAGPLAAGLAAGGQRRARARSGTTGSSQMRRERAGERFGRVDAAPADAVARARNEGESVGRRPRDDVGHELGGKPCDAAEAVFLPGGDEAPGGAVVGDRRPRGGEGNPPPGALAAALHRPGRRAAAAGADRPAEDDELPAAGAAQQLVAGPAREAPLREQKTEEPRAEVGAHTCPGWDSGLGRTRVCRRVPSS